jgi:hypothetical protein
MDQHSEVQFIKCRPRSPIVIELDPPASAQAPVDVRRISFPEGVLKTNGSEGWTREKAIDLTDDVVREPIEQSTVLTSSRSLKRKRAEAESIASRVGAGGADVPLKPSPTKQSSPKRPLVNSAKPLNFAAAARPLQEPTPPKTDSCTTSSVDSSEITDASHSVRPQVTQKAVDVSELTDYNHSAATQHAVDASEVTDNHELSVTQQAVDEIWEEILQRKFTAHECTVRGALRQARTLSSKIHLPEFTDDKPVAIDKKVNNQLARDTQSINEADLLYMDMWRPTNSKKNKPRAITIVDKHITSQFSSSSDPTPPPKSIAVTILRNNVLSENNTKLHNLPWFDDDHESEHRYNEMGLSASFHFDQKKSTQYLLNKIWARVAEDAVLEFLDRIGTTEAATLRYLLSPSFSSPSDSDVLAQFDDEKSKFAWKQRDKSLRMQTPRHSDDHHFPISRQNSMWVTIVDNLPQASSRELAIASLACSSVARLSEFKAIGRGKNPRFFSIWLVLKGRPIVQCALQSQAPIQPSSEQQPSSSQYRSLACRICYNHDCLQHGEILQAKNHSGNYINPTIEDNRRMINAFVKKARDQNELKGQKGKKKAKKVDWDRPDWDLPMSEDSGLSDIEINGYRRLRAPGKEFEADISNTNFKRRVIAPKPREVVAPEQSESDSDSDSDSGRDEAIWQPANGLIKENDHSKSKVFYPCDHEGSCASEQCSCWKQRIPCEKSCGCNQDCSVRFRGCQCSSDKPCSSSRCECRALNRECDPDLCGCSVFEVLDPQNRKQASSQWRNHKCGNCDIQLGLKKATFLGNSTIDGATGGLFAGERISKDDFVDEYIGELLSPSEQRRREVWYYRTNYFFDISQGKEC